MEPKCYFTPKIVAKETTVLGEDSHPLLNAKLLINVRVGGCLESKQLILAFDFEAMGWKIELANSPWKE